MSTPPASFTFQVSPEHAGGRLDALVAAQVDHCSRSFATTLIRNGSIVVDGVPKKPGYLVKAGETVSGRIDTPAPARFQAEAIPLHILHEDDALLVVNKAPGMVVHPAPGHVSGTLVNALMHHCPDLAGISGCLRPGIVHRLDKGTSGAIVVAKTTRSMHHLAAQFKARTVQKRYLALVYGEPRDASGHINRPIGRHPSDRKKMSVHTRVPRPAFTDWAVRERFGGASLLDVAIGTGRTHQIRVHCKTLGHPVVGDPVYFNRGERKRLADVSPRMQQAVAGLARQMLHAWQLSFQHPESGATLAIKAPLPEDMALLLERLRAIAASR